MNWCNLTDLQVIISCKMFLCRHNKLSTPTAIFHLVAGNSVYSNSRKKLRWNSTSADQFGSHWQHISPPLSFLQSLDVPMPLCSFLQLSEIFQNCTNRVIVVPLGLHSVAIRPGY